LKNTSVYLVIVFLLCAAILFSQNCKISPTPVATAILKKNRVKELKEFIVDTAGKKTIFLHYFLNANGEAVKECFYPTYNTNKEPFISECSYNPKTHERLFIKTHNDGKELLVLEKDIEYLSHSDKIIKKVSEVNDGTLTKTFCYFDTLDASNETKKVYRIHPPTGDTLSITFNEKTAKKHVYVNRWKIASGWQTESTETVYDTPKSGTTKTFKNNKLTSIYEFGKSKEESPYEKENYGLPLPEPKNYKVHTNDDLKFTPAKDTVNCKFVVHVSEDLNEWKTSKIVSKKTGLLLKEQTSYQNKKRDGKLYEYVMH